MSEDGEPQSRWKELAERITQKQDSEKLTELLEQLLKALDNQRIE